MTAQALHGDFSDDVVLLKLVGINPAAGLAKAVSVVEKISVLGFSAMGSRDLFVRMRVLEC